MHTPAALPPHIRAHAPEAARAFTAIIARLIDFLATFLRRIPHRFHIAIALHNRLNRITRRFNRLMGAVASDTSRSDVATKATADPLGSPCSDSPAPDSRATCAAIGDALASRELAKAPRAPKPPIDRPHRPSDTYIPRAHAWLLRDLAHHGGLIAQRLETLLTQAETAALLEATPAAAKLLRPLCHILGIKPAALNWPKPKPRPRPDRPKKPRRLGRKALKQLLHYPNIHNRPMNFLPRKNRRV